MTSTFLERETRWTNARGKTIYRKCACGETAHDLALRVAADTGRRLWVFACRNCAHVRAIDGFQVPDGVTDETRRR